MCRKGICKVFYQDISTFIKRLVCKLVETFDVERFQEDISLLCVTENGEGSRGLFKKDYPDDYFNEKHECKNGKIT